MIEKKCLECGIFWKLWDPGGGHLSQPPSPACSYLPYSTLYLLRLKCNHTTFKELGNIPHTFIIRISMQKSWY